jgi:hypothetical protein
MTFAVPRPWPAFGFDPLRGQPRTERRDKHRVHPVRTPWNGIGLGMGLSITMTLLWAIAGR